MQSPSVDVYQEIGEFLPTQKSTIKRVGDLNEKLNLVLLIQQSRLCFKVRSHAFSTDLTPLWYLAVAKANI
jgi:hypothetical protein